MKFKWVGGDIMADTLFVRASDVAKEMGVSETMPLLLLFQILKECLAIGQQCMRNLSIKKLTRKPTYYGRQSI